MNRKQRRHQKPHQQPMIRMSTVFQREADLKQEFTKEIHTAIRDTCDMYSISLAMVLSDKYHQTAEQIQVLLDRISALADEFLESRLSVADCRRALIDEIGLSIGDDATYVPLETKPDECETST